MTGNAESLDNLGRELRGHADQVRALAGRLPDLSQQEVGAAASNARSPAVTKVALLPPALDDFVPHSGCRP